VGRCTIVGSKGSPPIAERWGRRKPPLKFQNGFTIRLVFTDLTRTVTINGVGDYFSAIATIVAAVIFGGSFPSYSAILLIIGRKVPMNLLMTGLSVVSGSLGYPTAGSLRVMGKAFPTMFEVQFSPKAFSTKNVKDDFTLSEVVSVRSGYSLLSKGKEYIWKTKNGKRTSAA
jgi:hypothetical protein